MFSHGGPLEGIRADETTKINTYFSTKEVIKVAVFRIERNRDYTVMPGKHSRLATLLKKKYEDNTEPLVRSVSDFNNEIVQNTSGKYTEIQEIKSSINGKVREAVGAEFGQSVNLQFSETTFNKIIENIRTKIS